MEEKCNFIHDLDIKYQDEKRKNNIQQYGNKFVCNIPVKVSIYGGISEDYIIRKGKLTRFLYVKNGCRVYFSDADILNMLLQIQNKAVMDSLIKNLISAYKGEIAKYQIWIAGKKYDVTGIPQVVCEQVLTNPKDIEIPFDNLLVLINLILSKDLASNPLWPNTHDFFKHTLAKYISLIKYYYYADADARQYLRDTGYNVDEDIYSNYSTPNKRDENRGLFVDFKKFEMSGLL